MDCLEEDAEVEEVGTVEGDSTQKLVMSCSDISSWMGKSTGTSLSDLPSSPLCSSSPVSMFCKGLLARRSLSTGTRSTKRLHIFSATSRYITYLSATDTRLGIEATYQGDPCSCDLLWLNTASENRFAPADLGRAGKSETIVRSFSSTSFLVRVVVMPSFRISSMVSVAKFSFVRPLLSPRYLL